MTEGVHAGNWFNLQRTYTIIFTYYLQTIVGLLEEANGYPRALFSSTSDITKRCRHILSPAFSVRKLKQVLIFASVCVMFVAFSMHHCIG